jgi:hypothetical protein
MADRTSAALFADIFKKLASDPTPQHVAWARELWPRMGDYPFRPYQMYCDDALLALGLAYTVLGADGLTLFYGPKETR